MENEDYIPEKSLKDQSKSVPIESLAILIELTKKRICKIKCSDGSFGTGFFCNIPYKDDWDSLKVLITNYHVINNNDIIPGKKINISINNEEEKKEIIMDESRKTYISETYDITIIELRKEDKIKKESFFEIDNKVFDENPDEIYLNKSIFLLHYPNGEDMNFSNGILKNIYEDKYTIEHLCDSSGGSSGGPLINSVNFNVIGIHKGGAKGNKNYNLGTLIKLPIEEFNNKKKENNKKEINNYYKEKEDNKEEIKDNIKKDYNADKKEINNYYNEKEDNKEDNKEEIKDNIKEEDNIDKKEIKIYEKDEYKEGNGKKIYENGNYYIGTFLNDLRDGKGILYYQDNKIKYEGDFVRDKFEGNGKYYYENGEYYVGSWLNSLKHGKGILYNKDNKIKYEGDFVKDKFEGNGKYYYESGNYYIGAWLKGFRHGKGIIYYKDNKIKYEGDFVKNRFEGNGTYYYENGEYYVGTFVNSLKHNKGILYYKDKNVKYEGEFVKDKFGGNGKYIYENGEYYIGAWLNGFRHGKGILYNKDNEIKYEGDFVYDKYIKIE